MGTNSFAQNFAGNELTQLSSPGRGRSGVWTKEGMLDKKIEGSAYLFLNWDGLFKVFVNDKEYYTIHNLNYNLTTDSLESKVSNDSVFQFDKEKIHSIKTLNKTYKFYSFSGSNKLYEQMFINNNFELIKKTDVNIIEGTLNPLTQVMSDSKITRKEKYYIKKTKGNFFEIELKKKQILKFLEDKEDMVSKFVSEKKLDFSNEKDLMTIFKYYSTL